MGANFSGTRSDAGGCGPPRPPRHDLRAGRPKLQKTSRDRPKNWTGTATNSRVNQTPVLIDARRLQKALALLSRRVNHPLPRLLFPVLIDALSGPDCRATVRLVSAATLVAELGDITRFDNPRQLMAYLGLVPSEHSSGRTRRQGGITKAGNGAARRMLIEAAGSYRCPPRISRGQLL